MAIDTNSTTTPPAAKEEVQGFFAKNRVWIILIIALVVGNIGTFFYQDYRKDQMKKDFSEAFVEEGKLAEEMVVYRNKRAAEEMTQSLVSSIRGEMLRGNKEQLNLSLIGLVQSTGADLVTIVDTLGIVYLSTDKKFENQSILDVLPVVPRRVDKAETIKSDLEEAITVTPVMADDHRIGTLILSYRPDNGTLDRLKKMQTIPDFSK